MLLWIGCLVTYFFLIGLPLYIIDSKLDRIERYLRSLQSQI